jgi:hypothetical protein
LGEHVFLCLLNLTLAITGIKKRSGAQLFEFRAYGCDTYYDLPPAITNFGATPKSLSQQEEEQMRFYNTSHQYYCGIDLHTKMMYVFILKNEGEILLH